MSPGGHWCRSRRFGGVGGGLIGAWGGTWRDGLEFLGGPGGVWKGFGIWSIGIGIGICGLQLWTLIFLIVWEFGSLDMDMDMGHGTWALVVLEDRTLTLLDLTRAVVRIVNERRNKKTLFQHATL